MVSAKELSRLRSHLQSEKFKERQEGYQAVRDAFRDDISLQSSNDKEWLAVFQTLFSAVLQEKAAYVKKGVQNATAVLVRRLADAASVVRWLAERTVTRWGKSTMKALIDHLYQTMVHNGNLLEPVALDYAKTLRTILTYQPHLDHLDQMRMKNVLHFSFSTILRDRLITDGTFDDDDEEEEEEAELDALKQEESELSSNPSATPGKRRRAESIHTTHSHTTRGADNLAQRPLSLEQIELAAVVRALLSGSSAFYISSESAEAPRNILRRFKRFFLRYPSDSSAHYDMVAALNSILANLALNTIREVSSLGQEIWNSLLESWNFRNRGVKEGLVLSFRRLLPYITHDSESISTSSERLESLDKVRRLCRLLDAEGDVVGRGGLETLSLDQIRLQIMSLEEQTIPFQMSSIRSGSVLSEQQALTWLAMELHADCLSKLFTSYEETGPLLANRNTKRQRLDEPISLLLDSIALRTSPLPSRVYRCQVLLFLIERHWNRLHSDLQTKMCHVLQQCVVEDEHLAQWALIGLASVSTLSIAETPPCDWDSLWSLVWRRWNVPSLSRASCHTANALIKSGHISASRITKDIETVATEIAFQGPPFPYDSVCAFLKECCQISRRDLRLYKLQFEDKCLSWLVEGWNVAHGSTGGFNSKSKVEAHSIGDILSLSAALCGLSKFDDIPASTVLPECASVDAKLDEITLAPLTGYMLDNRVSTDHLERRSVAAEEASLADQNNKPGALSTKFSYFLERSLVSLHNEWEGRDLRSVATSEKIKRTLDIAVLGLYFQATLRHNGYRDNRKVVQAACGLVQILHPIFTWSSWSPHERHLIIDALSPLTYSRHVSTDPDDQCWQPLTDSSSADAGESSVLAKLQRQRQPQRSESQRLVWESSDIQETFESLFGSLRSSLLALGGAETQNEDPDEGDGFGSVMRKDKVSSGADANTRKGISLQPYFAAALSIMTAGPMLQMQWKEAPGDPRWVDLLLDFDDDHYLVLAPFAWASVSRRELAFGLGGWDRVLDDLAYRLKGHQLSHNAQMHHLVVYLLQATTHIWLDPSNAQAPMVDNCRALFTWLVNLIEKDRCDSWRVRDQAVILMDHYMSLDPSQTFWAREPEEMDASETPSDSLKRLARDGDIRVRYRAVIAVARLFRHTLNSYQQESDNLAREKATPLYLQVSMTETATFEKYEHNLVRLVLLANIMVVSAEIRRAPYADMLYMVLGSGAFNLHVTSLLMSLIHKIGFHSLRQLFETYAPSVTLKFLEDQRDISRLPASVLGFSSRRESADAVLRLGLPLALLSSPEKQPELWRQFRHVISLVGTSEDDALKGIFPIRVALKICSAFDSDNVPSPEHLSTLWRTVGSWPSHTESHLQVDAVVFHLDSIMSYMLLTIGEMDMGSDGDLSRVLRSSVPAIASDLELLTKFTRTRESGIHRPSAPLYGAQSVLQAITWLEQRLQAALPVAETLYHVLQRLLHAISSTPLANERVRGVNAVCILCGLYGAIFRSSPALLRALLYGMVPVFSHPSLSHRAQSVIHWACVAYSEVAKPDPRFPELLVRVANVAFTIERERVFGHASDSTNVLDWIEALAAQMQSIPQLASQIESARLLWPRTIQGVGKSTSIAYQDISRTLADDGFTSNKFRLVQRLQGTIREKRGFRSPSSDFWALKGCIPSDADLLDADLDAYLDVLATQLTRIAPLRGLQEPQTIGQRHQNETRSSRKTSGSFMMVLPHHAIISVLLDRMFHNTVVIRDAAYQSLRFLLSLPNNYLDTWKNPPEEVLLLAGRPTITRPAENAQLDHLALDERYINLAADFPAWIKTTTQFLCAVLGGLDPFYAQLGPLVQADHDFAAELFPVAVHELLRRQPNELSRSDLSTFLVRLLEYPMSSLSVQRTVVETCLHLRNFHHNPADDSATGNNRWLSVDYNKLATAATKCGAYTTALLFLELGREASSLTLDDYLSRQESILYDIYSHIEEPDGFYGIKSQDVTRFLVRRFRHENEWDKAFRFDGAAFEALSSSDVSKASHSAGVVQALHSSGLNQLAVAMQQNSSQGADLSTTDIELAWRTENWELPIPDNEEVPGYNLFRALRSIHREGESTAVHVAVNEAIRREVGSLRDLGNESMTEVRSCVRRLLSLREAKTWILPPVQEAFSSNDWSSALTARWSRPASDSQFADMEPVMATRISLLHSAQARQLHNQIGNVRTPLLEALIKTEKLCLLYIAQSAREASISQTALKCVTSARHLEADTPTFDTLNEFAHVLWAHQEEKLAIETVDQLLGRAENLSATTQALAMSQQGEWLAAACLKPPMVIRDDYFDPAYQVIQKAQKPSSPGRHSIVLFRYALFAERQYQAVVESDETGLLKHDMETKRKEVSDLDSLMQSQVKTPQSSGSLQKLSHDRRKAALLLEQDSQKYKSHVQKLDVFLRDSITMFADCLQLSDVYDEDVLTRLCSLWFRNFEDTHVQQYIGSAISSIPSRKFTFFAHQLTALLSTSITNGEPSSSSTNALEDLVLRLCREHPYHSLYQVHALRMGDGSKLGTNADRSDARRRAATNVLNQFRGKTVEGNRLRTIEGICEAYIEWAVWDIPQPDSASQGNSVTMPRNAKLIKIQTSDVPIPTSWTPVDPSCQYKDVVGIQRYASKYKTSGGVNLPKINDCYGTDGKVYRQVFKGAGGQKGGDDLRQDAVIGQVFELANQVLRKDPQTRRRDLSVRTYKVIPLTTQAGVLEFVPDSQPLQEWLNVSHKRYNPNDITLSKGQVKLKHHQMRSDRTHPQYPAATLRIFRDIKSHFHPVLRHYFLEKFMVPRSWFQMRLAYSRSVAVTSIVGHIVGLGDRHVSNILIDQISGELVHIDLGIAFDQGQLLPIPERVPFRLTDDIIDGLGMSRTEGVFRRCAEETLRVLRDRSEVVETVLQVFKHDPLHSWTANPFKLKRAQEVLVSETGAGGTVNPVDAVAGDNAERAIRGVRHKLDKSLNVQYTVNELITSATDEHNLCLIFGGWSPHA